MRTPISNRNMGTFRALLVIFCALIFLGLHFLSLPANDSLAVVPVLFLLFYYVFIGRFYKVEADNEYLYYSDLRKQGKIGIKNLVSVKDEWFPYNSFGGTVYGITVKYYNEKGRLKKIKFLSPETNWGGDPNQIPEIKFLIGMIGKN